MADVPITIALLRKVAALPKVARRQMLEQLGKQEWRRCTDSLTYWLDAAAHAVPYAYTFDPHQVFYCRLCNDTTTTYNFNHLEPHLQLAHAIPLPTPEQVKKHFEELPPRRPFTLLPYMPAIFETLRRDQLVAIEKSRDMMATWLVVAACAWDAYFHGGREIIFQSENGLKAAELVERAYFILKNQPAWLQRRSLNFAVGPNRSGVLLVGGGKVEGGSEILGFPQGPDQVRMFHPTLVFLDEAAFQVEAAAAFAAMKPAIQNGGRAVLLSSANPSFFMHICRDTLGKVTE